MTENYQKDLGVSRRDINQKLMQLKMEMDIVEQSHRIFLIHGKTILEGK